VVKDIKSFLQQFIADQEQQLHHGCSSWTGAHD
jgi:hypothetical protein